MGDFSVKGMNVSFGHMVPNFVPIGTFPSFFIPATQLRFLLRVVNSAFSNVLN